jgi:geranyl-CoA carboxylase beta subunit
MGPAQARSVLRTVAERKMRRTGAVTEELLASMVQKTAEVMASKSHALANTARLWDDGMIDPRDTRDVVAFALSVCIEGDTREVNTNTFGIARL